MLLHSCLCTLHAWYTADYYSTALQQLFHNVVTFHTSNLSLRKHAAVTRQLVYTHDCTVTCTVATKGIIQHTMHVYIGYNVECDNQFYNTPVLVAHKLLLIQNMVIFECHTKFNSHHMLVKIIIQFSTAHCVIDNMTTCIDVQVIFHYA